MSDGGSVISDCSIIPMVVVMLLGRGVRVVGLSRLIVGHPGRDSTIVRVEAACGMIGYHGLLASGLSSNSMGRRGVGVSPSVSRG